MNVGTNTNQLQVHFIAGMSRSGITWFSRALNLHPEIAVFGQSRFWGKHYLQPDASGFYRAPQLARLKQKINEFEWNATVGAGQGCLGVNLNEFRGILIDAIDSLDDESLPRDAYLVMAEAVASIKGARIVLEKTPHHVLHANRIRQQFPTAALLLLHCEPAVHMAVLKAQPDLKYHPLAASLIWRKYNSAIHIQLDNSPHLTQVIEASSLAKDPVAQLVKLTRSLGVANFDGFDAMYEFDYGVPGGQLPQLDGADSFWMRHVNQIKADSGLTAIKSADVFRSMVTLPSYILNNIQVSMKETEGSLFDYYRRWLFGGRE